MEGHNINVQTSFVTLYEKYAEYKGTVYPIGEYGVGIFRKAEVIGQDILNKSHQPMEMPGLGFKLNSVQLYEEITSETVIGELNWEKFPSRPFAVSGEGVSSITRCFDIEERNIVEGILSSIKGQYDDVVGIRPL